MVTEAKPAPPKREGVEHFLEDGKQITIDWPQVEKVLGLLVDAYQNNKFPYNQDSVRVPHDPRHMPETMPRGGTEHAMFLWTTCYYMRGGIKSVDAIKRLATIYDQRPDLFDCAQAAEVEPEEVAGVLKENGLGFQASVGALWVENARRMQERWGGDPRNIFKGVDSYEKALERIQNDGNGKGFIGFQEKMVSMATYYLMDDEMIEPFVFPLPVDLHVLRVSVANELLVFEGYEEDENLYSSETLRELRTLYYEYAVHHEINPLRLCDALWLLSQSSCGKHPGNITLEPDGRKNRNGRKTNLVPLPVDVNDVNQQRAYENSCRCCPIESTCRWNVPGKIYYVQGELKRRGERVRFPLPAQGSLFSRELN
jgi:hypothetical protein